MSRDRGSIIPDAILGEIQDAWLTNGPYWHLFPRPALRPLTRMQRLRLRWYRVRWAIHDHLFPECQEDSW